ncbi:hypothetical protein K493DRAFT_316542 [Basidiobolus meristosporus CBS 931.73]|uniref:Uncharacterized protein n=1 Tax=Basidiobolus meristosporus CBS 931.73 TaxID=1314790 RepID=A0A1Y1Y3D7_9FUNG|nr:hypothetical protein K493DRAFT_316542 [Basidiobolus meristosporus CBS 931.73]|eukprot:ORX92542.1 hypothetical protein K493DRAFT_316542 [Basidiobolus meristosporus CBS 931.73]
MTGYSLNGVLIRMKKIVKCQYLLNPGLLPAIYDPSALSTDNRSSALLRHSRCLRNAIPQKFAARCPSV